MIRKQTTIEEILGNHSRQDKTIELYTGVTLKAKSVSEIDKTADTNFLMMYKHNKTLKSYRLPIRRENEN